ncbi:hypothetical protein SAMN05216490_2805 [Mucilaginibacter mallensis]|uniref:Uncharacterized protein n=1 Tax=Mucilaginibacter mallensis TaxID=652787 RepID=A0A1H1YQ98_MUCMA|nr:pyrimidine/purine nucleoside phosphorylase [Mucilaginibacter mallensis]SDT23296.1 hypothetical protein SAMN05216490_2805 [Mucilaginibacter mallensis]
MSDSTEGTVSHNVYFDGKVKSLALDTDKGKATVGVMKKGNYQFSTSTPEKMIIIAGIMDVKLPEGSWTKYYEKDEFDVASGVIFDIICDTDVAYICYYE